MKKRVLSSILAGVLAVSVFAGCGSKTEDNSQAADNSTTPATEAAAEESTEAAGGTVESKGTIKVAASATPHAEILAAAKPILAEQGWDLEVTEFDDYVLPNEVVESGEMDANYFQHVPYLDSFNEEKGTHLVEVGKIHYEPFGIYPGTKSSLDGFFRYPGTAFLSAGRKESSDPCHAACETVTGRYLPRTDCR